LAEEKGDGDGNGAHCGLLVDGRLGLKRRRKTAGDLIRRAGHDHGSAESWRRRFAEEPDHASAGVRHLKCAEGTAARESPGGDARRLTPGAPAGPGGGVAGRTGRRTLRAAQAVDAGATARVAVLGGALRAAAVRIAAGRRAT